MNREDAEALAISALGFISGDSRLLHRFLAITGIEADDIRRAAGEPGFLAGVLHFIAAHEPTLLAFAQAADVQPDQITQAMRLLPSGDDEYERST